MYLSQILIDRLLILLLFFLSFEVVMKEVDICFLFNFFDLIYNNEVFYFFLLVSFFSLFIINFNSIALDYIRPYFFIFKQFSLIISFVIIVCLFF
jgi:hypothetical protein